MSLPLSALQQRSRAFIDDVILYRHTPPDEEARVAEYARIHTVRVTRALMIAVCTVGLLWWPFDFVLYADRPDVIREFAWWRTSVVVLSLGYYFTCDRWDLLRRHHTIWATFFGAGLAFLIAASIGSLGGLEQPWFASLYFVPIMSFPFLLRPGERCAGTFVASMAALVGFFGMHPANLAHRDVGTAFGLMLFGVGVAVCAGHAMYHWFRLGFLKSERLDVRTRELEDLTRTLGVRVDERTAELRLLAAHVDKLHETERGALGRELHDELGQLLSSIRMELDIADRVRRRGGDTAPHLEKLGELLDATLTSTRSILSHLRPRILDDFGLVAAAEWLAADAGKRAGIKVAFTAVPEDFTVPDEVATGVFRIVQESLTNVLRHANAKRVTVGLRLDDEGLVATISDDGVGLPPVGSRRKGSMGLLGMRERAHALGGSLDIVSALTGGTVVTVRLPARIAERAVTREVA